MGFLFAWLLLVLIISVHEFAHALAADRLGDPTPRLAGRLTLNPLAHIDMIGTVLLPLIALMSGGAFFIGWAKPTPFDPFNLRNPKKDSAIIAFAGPVSNLAVAFILSLFVRLPILGLVSSGLADILILIIRINVGLAIFNLIPISPLDGFHVIAGLLPQKYYSDWMELAPYGMIFLLLLIFPIFGTSPILTLISPIVNFILSLLLPASVGGII